MLSSQVGFIVIVAIYTVYSEMKQQFTMDSIGATFKLLYTERHVGQALGKLKQGYDWMY